MKHKKASKGFMAIKIDFDKAYDRLRGSFVKDALTQLQLLPMLVDVIYRCISTCSMSVLYCCGMAHPQTLSNRHVEYGTEYGQESHSPRIYLFYAWND